MAPGAGFESLLLLPGLEGKMTSGELAEIVCQNASVSLIEQLGEYAALFRGSRQLIVCALDICLQRRCGREGSQRLRGIRDEILALSMLESLYGGGYEK